MGMSRWSCIFSIHDGVDGALDVEADAEVDARYFGVGRELRPVDARQELGVLEGGEQGWPPGYH